MNPSLITALGAAFGLLVAMATLALHFDKRNADRFESLQKQIDATSESLQKQIDATRESLSKEIVATKEVLRAKMKEMRAELRLEIRDFADRRISTK